MSKIAHHSLSSSLPPAVLFPCPNPACRRAVFGTAANLNKHFGKKPECHTYAMSLLANWKQVELDPPGKHISSTMDFPSTLQDIAPQQEKDSEIDSTTTDDNFPTDNADEHMNDYEDLNNFGIDEEDDNVSLPGYQTTYTKSQQIEIYLLKLCTEMEAPLYAFEEIMKWARNAYTEGYQFLPRQANYRSQIDKLEKWTGMETHRPEEVLVQLPGATGEDTIKVTRFDFTTQLRSLLDDAVLNRDENLVINPEDRFQRYSSPDGRLGECLSGSWYNHAWDEMEKDGICDFMIPIILYIDKTQISISGKLSIFPVQMSLGIFTEKVGLFV
jgi:hypothetical protein